MPGGNDEDEIIDNNNKSRTRNIFLGNSDSEFTLVVGDRSKVSSDFGLHCISTIDELNKRIANLDSIRKPSKFGNDLSSDDEPIDERKDSSKEAEKSQQSPVKQQPVQSNSKKPLLVELHSFPGFKSKELTPLPSNLDALQILKIITEAKEDLHYKPSFKTIFIDFFYSTNSQGILQDAFWWYFCHKYQPAADPQEKLFDRIARNYTSLVVRWTGSKHQDKLFKDYADLMSQAVYSTFCHAFPTSYRQFNADFRDDILYLVNLWMMGTKPAPRTWDQWNFEGIEPAGLRKNVTIMEDVETPDLENDLESIDNKAAGPRRMTIFGLSGRKTSVKRPPNLLKRNSIFLKGPNKSDNPLNILRGGGKKKESMGNVMQNVSSVIGLVERSLRKNSCAAGGGPTFERVVFNLHGRSPLVEHFLNSHQLSRDAGTSVLVQRTEIAALPPLNAETYQEVVNNVRRRSKQLKTKHKNMVNTQRKELKELVQKTKVDSQHFTRCQEKLLSNPQEVRKLSELLRTTVGKEDTEDAEKRAAKLRSLVNHAFEEGDD